MVYHYADGNYYVSRITISGNEVPFNPLHKDDVLLRWSSGSWLVLGGNKDFEDDGAIDISFYPCNSDDPISSYSVHLTWEALYELEQNNGKTIRKYWNVVNRDTDHASYEFVVEYPNGHEYKMSFEAKGVLSFTKSSVTWLGESYSLLPVYSDLPCRFTTTWWDLWHESSQKTIFTEVTTHMKTDGTQELCFKDENTTFYYPMEDSFNYLIGQDNMLIIGQSYLYTNTNGMPELNIYPVFHHLMIYDGVCPNCLESKSRMAIDFHECISKCSKCGRWYDLSNYGVIIRGSGGKALIRYPAFRNTELNRIEI